MSDKSNALKYNHREKSIRVPFVTYADTEHLLEKKKLHVITNQKIYQQ